MVGNTIEERGQFFTPFEQISHGLVNDFSFHHPLCAFDPSRGRNQRNPPFLLSTDRGSGVFFLP